MVRNLHDEMFYVPPVLSELMGQSVEASTPALCRAERVALFDALYLRDTFYWYRSTYTVSVHLLILSIRNSLATSLKKTQ